MIKKEWRIQRYLKCLILKNQQIFTIKRISITDQNDNDNDDDLLKDIIYSAPDPLPTSQTAWICVSKGGE